MEKNKTGRTQSPDEPQVSVNGTKTAVTVTAALAEGVTLQIKATPGAWERMESLYADSVNYFHHDFFNEFVYPACATVHRRLLRKPRGQHKKQKPLTDMMRRDAAWLYVFFQFWAEHPSEQPQYLWELLKMAEDEDYSVRTVRIDISPRDLTQFCLEKKYAGAVALARLYSFSDPDSFYKTYILESGLLPRIRQRFHKKSPAEVARIAYHPTCPVNWIFRKIALHCQVPLSLHTMREKSP